MPYKNGREAKNGDRVIWLPSYRGVRISPIYDVTEDSLHGHAKFIVEDPLPLYVNLGECLHVDDMIEALSKGMSGVIKIAEL
jgi:hypothetical protein